MVRFKNVLVAIFFSIITLCVICATGCNKDQSSGTQQQPAASPQASAPAQVPPPAPAQAPAPMPQQAMPAAPVGPQNVNQIQLGMTSQQVLQIMGSPTRVEQERGKVEWKYYFPQGGKFEVYLQNDIVVSMKSKLH